MVSLKSICALVSFLGVWNIVVAQTLPDPMIRKIDGLLSPWNRTGGPGMIAGVVTADGLAYIRYHGLANLEQPAPITPKSMFYMASVSKQFAGYAIAQLVEKELVDPSADIHSYLPWLKDFGKKITVSNLLNHTSGLRDDIGLSRLSGLNGDGILTQDLALKIISRQHSLNFEPGEKYSYSNTNYVLLSEIVKHVSGMSFRAYADSAIFKPLGMTNARFVDDPNELIQSRASSYMLVNSVWKNYPHNIYTMGDGGMFCSAEDMARWLANFWSEDPRTRRVVQLMTTGNQLSNGRQNSYAMGISSEVRGGFRRLTHNGALSGYRTIVVVYPAQKVAAFAFSNDRDSGIYSVIEELADLVAGVNFKPAQDAGPLADGVNIDSAILARRVGNYISETGFRVDITLKNGRLYAEPNELTAMSPVEFYVRDRGESRISFSGDSLRLTGQQWPLLRVGRGPEAEELTAYTGSFYSPELDLVLTIRLEDGQLAMHNARLGSSKITLRGYDHMYTDHDLMRHLLVKRDKANRIVGLSLHDGSTMNLIFGKVLKN